MELHTVFEHPGEPGFGYCDNVKNGEIYTDFFVEHLFSETQAGFPIQDGYWVQSASDSSINERFDDRDAAIERALFLAAVAKATPSMAAE